MQNSFDKYTNKTLLSIMKLKEIKSQKSETVDMDLQNQKPHQFLSRKKQCTAPENITNLNVNFHKNKISDIKVPKTVKFEDKIQVQLTYEVLSNKKDLNSNELDYEEEDSEQEEKGETSFSSEEIFQSQELYIDQMQADLSDQFHIVKEGGNLLQKTRLQTRENSTNMAKTNSIKTQKYKKNVKNIATHKFKREIKYRLKVELFVELEGQEDDDYLTQFLHTFLRRRVNSSVQNIVVECKNTQVQIAFIRHIFDAENKEQFNEIFQNCHVVVQSQDSNSFFFALLQSDLSFLESAKNNTNQNHSDFTFNLTLIFGQISVEYEKSDLLMKAVLKKRNVINNVNFKMNFNQNSLNSNTLTIHKMLLEKNQSIFQRINEIIFDFRSQEEVVQNEKMPKRKENNSNEEDEEEDELKQEEFHQGSGVQKMNANKNVKRGDTNQNKSIQKMRDMFEFWNWIKKQEQEEARTNTIKFVAQFNTPETFSSFATLKEFYCFNGMGKEHDCQGILASLLNLKITKTQFTNCIWRRISHGEMQNEQQKQQFYFQDLKLSINVQNFGMDIMHEVFDFTQILEVLEKTKNCQNIKLFSSEPINLQANVGIQSKVKLLQIVFQRGESLTVSLSEQLVKIQNENVLIFVENLLTKCIFQLVNRLSFKDFVIQLPRDLNTPIKMEKNVKTKKVENFIFNSFWQLQKAILENEKCVPNTVSLFYFYELCSGNFQIKQRLAHQYIVFLELLRKKQQLIQFIDAMKLYQHNQQNQKQIENNQTQQKQNQRKGFTNFRNEILMEVVSFCII